MSTTQVINKSSPVRSNKKSAKARKQGQTEVAKQVQPVLPEVKQSLLPQVQQAQPVQLAQPVQPAQPVQQKTPIELAREARKKKYLDKKNIRCFKLYDPEGRFFDVFKPVAKKDQPVKKTQKSLELLPEGSAARKELESKEKKKEEKRDKKKSELQTTRGRYRCEKLSQAAKRAYNSIIRAFNKSGKKILNKNGKETTLITFGIVECTKNKPNNKNKLFIYKGKRVELDKIKVLPEKQYMKKPDGPKFSSFVKNGERKYLKEVTKDKYDEKNGVVYERKENKVVVETKYYAIVDDKTPESERVTGLSIYSHKHVVTKNKGFSIISQEKEKKKQERIKKERKIAQAQKKKSEKKAGSIDPFTSMVFKKQLVQSYEFKKFYAEYMKNAAIEKFCSEKKPKKKVGGKKVATLKAPVLQEVTA
jgi:hypothetical protein